MKAIPCPYCQGVNKVATKYGIGSNIRTEESSGQCECGAWRSHTNVTPSNGNQSGTYLGKWQDKKNAWAPEPWEL